MLKPARSLQSGYSLAEMIVVVAIIGLLSLVTVPQFMTFHRQGKMRSAVRQFTGDLRDARQRAISTHNLVAISFTPGATPTSPDVRGRYAIYEFSGWDTTTTPWTRLWTRIGNDKQLDQAVYFLASDFASDAVNADNLDDIVFKSDGTIVNMVATPNVIMKTDYKVPNNRCTLTMQVSGAFNSALTTE